MKRRALLAAAFAAALARAEPVPAAVQRLLERGEAQLARCRAAEAIALFEQAAALAHSGDIETALVRGYMQAGEYRRALAFAAHTAGAHADEPGGAALYACLLEAGGQPAIAARVLAQAGERGVRPSTIRLAPYAQSEPRGRVAFCATLLGDGRLAIAPGAAARGAARVWLRNGLGATVQARATQVRGGIVLLELARALPPPPAAAAPADPFPGSVGLPVLYATQPHAHPAWPVLRSGFVGAAAGRGHLALGIDLGGSAALGGPVYDAAGRLAGLVLPGPHGQPMLAGAAALRRAGVPLAAADSAVASPRKAGFDEVYEGALRQALQVIRS